MRRLPALLAAVAAFLLLITSGVVLPARAQIADPTGDPVKEVEPVVGSFLREPGFPDWVSIIEPGTSTAQRPLVVRLADTQFLATDRRAYFVRRVVQANDAASLQEIGQLELVYAPQYQRLRLHRLRVQRDGTWIDRIHTASVRFLQRETGLEQGIVLDHVTASIVLEDLRPGDTLDYAFSIEGQNPVFAGKFFDFASWETSNGAARRRVVLTHDAVRPIQWKAHGPLGATVPSPNITESGGRRTVVFEAEGIEPGVSEEAVPAGYPTWRWIEFSEYRDWAEVARWAEGLFRPSAPLGAEMEPVIARLRAIDDEERRVVEALAFVQAEIRYFSLWLGESSHRPQQPAEVLARRYGDCKDKSFFLIELLRAVGIEARPVLVSISEPRGVADRLPSPAPFDHAIVEVALGGRRHYVDPTRFEQRGSLARLGQAHESAQVLVAALETTSLETVVAADQDIHVNEMVQRVTIPAMAAAGELELQQTWNGVEAELMRFHHARATPEQFAKSLSRPIEAIHSQARLLGAIRIDDDRDRNRFSATLRFAVPDLLVTAGDGWVLRYQPLNLRGHLALPTPVDRKSPVSIPGYPIRARFVLEATFPPEVSVIRDPTFAAVRNEFLAFSSDQTFRGNRATVAASLEMLADRVPAPSYLRFLDDIKRIDQGQNGVVVVRRADLRSAAVSAAVPDSLGGRMQARFQRIVDGASRAIDSGRLTGADLAEALCERAIALEYLARNDEAIRDAGEAVKLTPDSPAALRCRAGTYFAAGDFNRAAIDLSRTISLGELRAEVFYRRALARFYLGRLDDAAADLEKASSIKDDGGTELYAEMWRTWTLRRLKRPLPATLLARAAADSTGAWPRPALAMLTGRITPEAMLEQVEKLQGDERELARVEAFFYLAQHHLADGNRARAIELLRAARASGITMYTEHVAAGHELRLLGEQP